MNHHHTLKDQSLKKYMFKLLLSLHTKSDFSIPHAAAKKQTVTLPYAFSLQVRTSAVSEPYPCSVMSVTDGVWGSTASWSL